MLKIFTPFLFVLSCIFVVVTFPGCEQIEPPDTSQFTLEDEIKLGQQLEEAINRNSSEFPLLDETDHANIYTYLNDLQETLAETGNITNANNGFNWSVKIIEDDSKGKAFALPGGPVYISTGLLKYLKTEHEFLALLAHEMAYADKNLIKEFLSEEFGLTVLLDVSLGSNHEIADLLLDLIVNSTYSETLTRAADDYSVDLVCQTQFDASGLVKMLERANLTPQTQPVWVNLRSNPSDRVNNLNAKINNSNCIGIETGENNYLEFLMLLP